MIDTFKMWYRFNDDTEVREALAVLLPKDASVSMLDDALDDDRVFYAFTRGEKILGNHGDFTVVASEVVYA